MKKLLFTSALLAGLATANATMFTFDFPGGFGDGGEEFPVVASAGQVLATGITYDDVSNLLSAVGVSYSGLTGTVTAAHFHGSASPSTAGTFGAGAGSIAGIAINLTPTGGTVGTLSGSGTLSNDQEINLLAGLWYVNVHTTFAGGGEIRGQLLPSPVPEPETYAALAGLGLVAFGVWRRVRK